MSDRGRAQAEAWAVYFATVELDAIACSDLSRGLETAQIIGPAYGALSIIAIRPDGIRLQALNLPAPGVFIDAP